VTADDVTHTLSVVVKATNPDGTGSAPSVPTGIVNSSAALQPTGYPVLSGKMIVGTKLSLSTGVWTTPPSSSAFHWQRCVWNDATYSTQLPSLGDPASDCLNIAGATGSTYTVKTIDIDHRLRGIVTVQAGDDTASVFSNTSGLAKAKVQTRAVAVVVGKPVELKFTLSKASQIPAGPVTFKVTNRGKLIHDFKVCSALVTKAAANACPGKGTKRLRPGQSQTLRIVLKGGKYEYLCTVPGHAAAGMKGLIGVGLSLSAAEAAVGTKPSTGGGGSASTGGGGAAPPATETLVGNPASGRTVFTATSNPTCASCHTMKAAGSTGTAGPNLDSLAPTQSQVVNAVTYGLPGGMPAFGATGQLNDQQIKDVASYVYQSTHG